MMTCLLQVGAAHRFFLRKACNVTLPAVLVPVEQHQDQGNECTAATPLITKAKWLLNVKNTVGRQCLSATTKNCSTVCLALSDQAQASLMRHIMHDI